MNAMRISRLSGCVPDSWRERPLTRCVSWQIRLPCAGDVLAIGDAPYRACVFEFRLADDILASIYRLAHRF